MKEISRRKFMKQALVMGTAMSTFPAILAGESQARDISRIVPHPNVDNLRVVGTTNQAMTRDMEIGCDWSRQNELVVPKMVWENIDKLAGELAQIGNPEKAWRTIFLKPPRKSWSDTVVAIKTNNISQQHTRSAVMSKICHVLTHILGVNPDNINIYDACHGGSISRYTPFEGLPNGVHIRNQWGGSSTRTPIPEPWKNGEKSAKCLKHLTNGSVDILINIALCKGHDDKFGGFTMTMKNHFGTFSPWPGHSWGGTDYLIAINKTPEILGAMDDRTGKVLFPRQQLCLVDGLWASEGGPGGHPTHQPNFLAMGVLSPVVDFQLATKFRRDKMGWEIDMSTTHRMLKEFGYEEKDLPEGGTIIEV